MYSRTQLFFRYLRYLRKASNGRGHGMHSPFVFDFITRVLNDRESYPAYGIVEPLRKLMKKDPSLISVADFGAGSRVDASSRRKLSAIARSSLKPRQFGQILFRMVKYFKPSTVLELGT